MNTISFLYDKETRVKISIELMPSSLCKIEFIKERNILRDLSILYHKYFKYITFFYKDYRVCVTTKDGESFEAQKTDQVNSFTIKKKKTKEQILLKIIKNYFVIDGQKEKVEACLIENCLSFDRNLISDFSKNHKSDYFDEEQYLSTLNESERKEYLIRKNIENNLLEFNANIGLTNREMRKLRNYVYSLSFDDKNKTILYSNEYNENVEKILNSFLTILGIEIVYEKYNESDFDYIDKSLINSDYIIQYGDNMIYSEGSFNLYNYQFKDDNETYVAEVAFDSFYEYYEEVKDKIALMIEKVKSEIDKIEPQFNTFIQHNLKK